MAVKFAERNLAKVAEEAVEPINLNEPFVGKSETTKRLVKLIEIGFDTKNVPVIWGPPGVGKTAIIHSIIEKRKMLMRVLIGSTMDPTDVAGLPVLRTLQDGSSVTAFALPEWFVEVRDYALAHPESGSVIFLEEITTATPPVQAALLTFIQDRRIGKTVLPDNVLIVVAGNPPSQAADGNLLAPPTANRFVHYDYVPSNEDWFEGMNAAWNKTVGEHERLMRSYVVGFLTERTDIINACPEDPEEAGQAWPSMRSWDNAARMLGQTKDEKLASILVKAAVGDKAGADFMEWMSKLSLPRYEAVMAEPEKINWASLRGDVLHMTLATVVQNVTVDNFNASVRVFEAAKKANKDDIVAGLILSFKRKAAEAYEEAGLDTKKLAAVFARLAVKIMGELHKKATAKSTAA
jgi:hypothetical protein